jgi:branched-chain amino acid transport system permease protein
MGTDRPVQCRCRGLRRDWRLYIGAAHDTRRGGPLRRLRPAGMAWLDRSAADCRCRRRGDRRHHLAAPSRAIAIQLVALNAETLTGGPFGVGFIPRAFGGFEDRPVIFNLANLLLVGLITALLYYALERLVRSPWGRVLRAIREDETAAQSLGKNANLFRIQAFALGAAIMGLAGAINAHFIGFIAPENYVSAMTFQVWAMLIIGGSGNNKGALLGAVLVWGLWSASGALLSAFVPGEYQARAAALQIVVIGVALAALLVFRPRGLLGEEKMISRFLKE